MKPKDLTALLRRAAAALENPDDLCPDDVLDLIEDLFWAAEQIEREHVFTPKEGR